MKMMGRSAVTSACSCCSSDRTVGRQRRKEEREWRSDTIADIVQFFREEDLEGYSSLVYDLLKL